MLLNNKQTTGKKTMRSFATEEIGHQLKNSNAMVNEYFERFECHFRAYKPKTKLGKLGLYYKPVAVHIVANFPPFPHAVSLTLPLTTIAA
jgi:hypothetical protein